MTQAAGWLDRLPDRWEAVPAKALFSERKQRSLNSDVHLTPSQTYGVLPQSEYMRVTGSRVVLNLESPESMKHIEEDDFVIHLRSFQGGIEHSNVDGKVSVAYTVLSPNRQADPRFYRWALKSGGYIQELRVTTNQLRDGQSIKFGQFASVWLPRPPAVEQRAIADYLDRETARIDTLIEKQEKLIETLRERFRSSVEQLVFGGTADTTKSQNHGVDWLPEIPTHWKTLQLGFVTDTLPGYAFPSDEFSDLGTDTRLLRGVNIKPGRIDWSEVVYWDLEAHPISKRFELAEGDLVLGMDRPFISGGVRVAKITRSDLPALLLQRTLRLRSRPGGSQEYLRYLLMTKAMLTYLEPQFTGVSVPHMSEWQVRKFVMPFPPLDEQRTIVEKLDRESLTVEKSVCKTRDFIDLTKERRAALITAAVTGQIDVREVAGG